MKIKCPGCAATLQIPDSAAGKVVKCKCGKQLRAPGGQAASGQAAAQPRPAAGSSQARPAPAPAPASGLFDELTDTDLAPIRSVQIPGAKAEVKAPGGSAAKMLDEAISGSDRRGQGLVMKGEAPRPPFLIFLGVMNGLSSLFYFGLMTLSIGLVDMVPAMAQEVPDADGAVFYLLAGMFCVMAVLSLATGISCFIRGKLFWYVVLVSYGWSLAYNIFNVIRKATGDDVDMSIIKGVGGILVGGGIWAWLHTESVRDYYQVESEPIWRTALIDATGFLAAGGLGAAILLMG
jgi:hypothetical protein